MMVSNNGFIREKDLTQDQWNIGFKLIAIVDGVALTTLHMMVTEQAISLYALDNSCGSSQDGQ